MMLDRPPKSAEQRRHRGDVAIMVGCALAVLAVMAGAAFLVWSVQTENLQATNTTPQASQPIY
jgi:type VI protein secretion system component VasK